MSVMFGYANPARFMRLSSRLLPWVAALALAALTVGVPMSFMAPPDYQQGETVRIMYVHVPAAWMAMFAYATIAVASLFSLIWRHPLADACARQAAPLGAGFTLIALVTGSLWGEPMWGTWWVWDARLTSVLLLFFLYLGYMALWAAIEDPAKAARAAAILGLAGAINLPVIKFSVDWWNTLHQPASVLRLDGPTIHPDMLWPLLVMGLAFQLVFVTLLFVGMRTEVRARRLHALRVARAHGAAGEARAA
ncbi:heme ABC transporter permease [Futiania mangrovi]|nr:heme ABC transporter permease [Futiania mangrovii]